MNAAVRAVVRVGIFTGARVFFVHEVGPLLCFHHSFSIVCLTCSFPLPAFSLLPSYIVMSNLPWLPTYLSHASLLLAPVMMWDPGIDTLGPHVACSI